MFSGLQVFTSDENVSNNSINDQQYGICNSYLLNVKSFDFFLWDFDHFLFLFFILFRVMLIQNKFHLKIDTYLFYLFYFILIYSHSKICVQTSGDGKIPVKK